MLKHKEIGRKVLMSSLVQPFSGNWIFLYGNDRRQFGKSEQGQ